LYGRGFSGCLISPVASLVGRPPSPALFFFLGEVLILIPTPSMEFLSRFAKSWLGAFDADPLAGFGVSSRTEWPLFFKRVAVYSPLLIRLFPEWSFLT